MKKAFTLLELLITLVVIGIIAGFAVPGYLGTRNRAIDREAQAMLVLMRAAQQTRDAEALGYSTCNSTALCNADPAPLGAGGLGLDLPGNTFNYRCPGGTGLFCCQATGLAAPAPRPGVNYCIHEGRHTAVLGACNACP